MTEFEKFDGKRLEEFRKAKGISIYKVAKDLNFPYMTVYAWEKYRTQPHKFCREALEKYMRGE